jgi:hypothetical protein
MFRKSNKWLNLSLLTLSISLLGSQNAASFPDFNQQNPRFSNGLLDSSHK